MPSVSQRACILFRWRVSYHTEGAVLAAVAQINSQPKQKAPNTPPNFPAAHQSLDSDPSTLSPAKSYTCVPGSHQTSLLLLTSLSTLVLTLRRCWTATSSTRSNNCSAVNGDYHGGRNRAAGGQEVEKTRGEGSPAKEGCPLGDCGHRGTRSFFCAGRWKVRYVYPGYSSRGSLAYKRSDPCACPYVPLPPCMTTSLSV